MENNNNNSSKGQMLRAGGLGVLVPVPPPRRHRRGRCSYSRWERERDKIHYRASGEKSRHRWGHSIGTRPYVGGALRLARRGREVKMSRVPARGKARRWGPRRRWLLRLRQPLNVWRHAFVSSTLAISNRKSERARRGMRDWLEGLKVRGRVWQT